MSKQQKAVYAASYKMNSHSEVYLHVSDSGSVSGLGLYEWNGNASSGTTYFSVVAGNDAPLQETANEAAHYLGEYGRDIDNKYFSSSEGIRFRVVTTHSVMSLNLTSCVNVFR